MKEHSLSNPLNRMVMGEAESAVDAEQLRRITSVHRGFLYQHLYAVACLLTLGRRESARIIIESDEDIEILVDGIHQYVQVKTRGGALQPSDIATTVARFDELRTLHANGERKGAAAFSIVTNTFCSPKLISALSRPDWPTDVSLITPADEQTQLPRPWPHIEAGLHWCFGCAAEVPFGSLSGETLVWKLAARVQYAATGAHDRTFLAEGMASLFEQFLLQLQDFPEAPPNYRPQSAEPPLITDRRIRLITGFSGAGKSSWAAQAALHTIEAVAYFDVGDAPAASVAANLARELVARFLGGRPVGLGGAMLQQSSGLDLLRACARRMATEKTDVTVIIDNCHRMNATAIREIVDAAPTVRFVFLGQPWNGAGLVEALLQIKSERLEGWLPDDIAAEFKIAGAPVEVQIAERVLHLTGGLPLYVCNAALVATRDFGGDAAAFCTSVEMRTNDVSIAQEIILAEAFSKLDNTTLRTAAVFTSTEVALSREELRSLFTASMLSEADTAKAIRQLRAAGFLVSYQGNRLALHDAVRPLAIDVRPLLPEGAFEAASQALFVLLMSGLRKERDISRLSFLFRLLPRIGRSDILVDVAADEMFHEQGDPRALRSEIERIADDEAKSPNERFWAHDALAYWESRDGGRPDPTRLKTMRTLVDDGGLEARDELNLIFKEMVHWGSEGNSPRVVEAYERGRKLRTSPDVDRMLRYNFAMCLFRVPSYARAQKILDDLIAEYFGVLGVREEQVVGKWAKKLHDFMPKPVDRDACKRLADCLNLSAQISVHLDAIPTTRRFAAMKFYGLGIAARSMISTGLELVDDFLDVMGDAHEAINVFEQHLLRDVAANQLTDMIIPVRSMYAVALAWGGRTADAQREFEVISAYSGSPKERQMLDERRRIIGDILAGRRRIVSRSVGEIRQRQATSAASLGRVGRNEKCPCGSGAKFKHCHGGK